MKKHLRILEQEADKLIQDSTVNAVLLTGSVAYGEAAEHSDLDIIILCDRDHFESEYIDGILVEKHFHKFETLKYALDKNAAEVYKYLYSKIIVDNAGKLNTLISKAKDIYSTYSTPKKEYDSIRYWLSATRIKLLAALDNKDEKRLSYLLSTNTWKVLEGVWAKNNKPMPPSSLAYAKHDELTDAPWEDWFDDLLTGNIGSRANAMMKLIDWICESSENSL